MTGSTVRKPRSPTRTFTSITSPANHAAKVKTVAHGQILLFRNFHRKRQHDAPGKLGIPLVLYGFHSVPERCTVCISGRRMGRQHDLGVDKLFLLVVEFCFLVVLTEQPFAALVSGPGNSGLTLAALDDCDFEMRTRNRHHPQKQKDRPARLLLMNGLESYSVVLAALERSAMRFGLRREPQKDSCKAAQGKCSFPWDGIGLAHKRQLRFHRAVCKTAISPERCIIAPYFIGGSERSAFRERHAPSLQEPVRLPVGGMRSSAAPSPDRW